MNMTVPTPPGSNKPPGIVEDNELNFTKLKPSSTLTRSDPTGNLPHDQLAKLVSQKSGQTFLTFSDSPQTSVEFVVSLKLADTVSKFFKLLTFFND